MTNLKTTKRALLSSVIALLVCFTMLLGTTFAWFTDSVTSAGNKIVAGTLEVDLLMADETGSYGSIAGEVAAIFGAENSLIAQNNSADTVWEPGKTQIAYLAVENKGNLDLKYNIMLNIVDGGLIGSLEYAIIDGAEYGDITATDWTAIKAIANAQTGDVVAGTTLAAPNGAITVAEKTEYFALAVHMKEEAGNKYQGKDITIDVTVLATQLASESDSFDNQYDANANVYTVTTTEEAQKALDLAEDGAIINFVAGNEYGMLYFRQSEVSEIVHDRDFTSSVYDEVKIRTIKNLTINGNGAKIAGFATEAGSYYNVWHSNEAAYPILESFIVLENVKIDNVAFTGNSDAISVTGMTSVDGLSVTNCTMHHAVNGNNKTFLVAQPNVNAVVGNVNGEAFEIQFANVTVDNCEASYVDRFILAFHSENLTVTNNTVSNVDQHFINLQAGLSDHTGVITITGNTLVNGADRFFRAAYLADAHLVLERNTVNNAFFGQNLTDPEELNLVKVNVRAGSAFTFTNYDNQIHTTANTGATFVPTVVQ